MNTQKGKENQLAVRRQTLLASQNVLSKEIDEVIKVLYPIGFDDFPDANAPRALISKIKNKFGFKVRPSVMFELSEKEIA